mmetsp:Transcript_64180/g.96752  ORF Transcript_64180/g.96752 Transcript_64180/m.96752 type:complete len:230 (+) Transcript_64180:1-690(+)
MEEWNELRKEIRKLESDIDLKLVSYSKLGISYSAAVASDDQIAGTPNSSSMYQISHSMAVEIEQLLSDLSDSNSTLAKIAAESSSPAHSSAVHQHQSKLRDYTKEYRQIRNKINDTHSSVELFVGATQSGGDGDNDRMDTLLRERGSLQASHTGADNFTNAGINARDSLRGQNQILRGTTSRISQIQGTFSSIDTIYAAIRRKYTRDCIILSVFTAFLTCFLLFWWLRS